MVFALLIFGLLLNAFIGLLALLKKDDKAARILVAVALFMMAWQVANFFADSSSGYALFWNRLAFALPLVILLLSNYFLLALQQIILPKLLQVFLIGGTALAVMLCFTSQIVAGVNERLSPNGIVVGYNPVYGQAYNAFIAWVLILVLFYVIQLSYGKHIRRGKDSDQLRIIQKGSIIAVAIALTTNIVIPNILKTSIASQLVPLTSVAFMSAFGVAILRHKLFDIRSFVLRASIYSVTATLLALCYIAPLILLFMLIFELPFNRVQFIIAVILGTVVATNFHKVQTWFNNVTKNIFFRDSYEPTEFFNELNKTLATTGGLTELLTSAKKLTQKYIKNVDCQYLLPINISSISHPSKNQHLYYSGSVTTRDLDALMNNNDKNVLLVSTIPSDNKIPQSLKDDDIAVVIRLMPSRTSKQSTGYMLLSPRRSGKAYDAFDLRIFETMTSTLDIAMQNALHYAEIQQFNSTLRQKIDEATRKLRLSNEKLRRMDETKDDFISMASHQLRTPLTSVKGYVSMVLDGDVGEVKEKQRELLNQSFQSSQRMANLISDLLNLSRINTGKFIIDLTPVYLPAVVEAEIAQLREVSSAKNIEVILKIPHEFPTLMLDEGKMHQVIMNLIDNAIYYTPNNGKVTIELIETNKYVEFKVTDTGIGVPRDAQKHLFSKMFRAANARKTRPDGTGLGLYMVKKVIMAQNGAVIFESTEGKGSMFGFHFSKDKVKVASSEDLATKNPLPLQVSNLE